MKPFTNRFVAETLKHPIYNGLDGEIIVGPPYKTDEDDDVFNRTSGPIRRFDGEPDFHLYVFDSWLGGEYSYKQRWLDICNHVTGERIVVLEQRLLKTPKEVMAYEEEMVNAGYEGAMLRSLDGLYKEGRCTLREQNIFKRKPFNECEAVIIGVEEAMMNLNERVINEMGLSHRASHQENKVPKNTLGKFVCQSDLWEKDFKAAPGKGFDDKRKKEIWGNKEAFIGLFATIKYQKYGSIDRPRGAKVIKLRPQWDL
jgi:DNA ligase-1